jgi:hypothetical protein
MKHETELRTPGLNYEVSGKVGTLFFAKSGSLTQEFVACSTKFRSIV